MDEETERALRGWHDGLELDLYGWARELALRVAMRALFGFDADSNRPGARLRARARLLRPRVLAPGAARPAHAVGERCKRRASGSTRLIYAEIADRRRTGHRGDDVLSLLLDAPRSATATSATT